MIPIVEGQTFEKHIKHVIDLNVHCMDFRKYREYVFDVKFLESCREFQQKHLF